MLFDLLMLRSKVSPVGRAEVSKGRILEIHIVQKLFAHCEC